MVRSHHPDVHVIALQRNAAAAARNIGVEHLDVPYVAFADDDSWWASEALPKAVALLDRHTRIGLLAARVLVGPQQSLDPTCVEMASSPLFTHRTLPGPRVLGFIACGAVVRRSAFLEVGGFDERFGVGGEEALFSLNLTSAGWSLCYVDDIVAHHHPSKSRDPHRRRRVVTRNALWTSWLRHPAPELLKQTSAALTASARDPAARQGVFDAVAGLPGVLKERRSLSSPVRTDVRTLNVTSRGDVPIRR